MYIYIHILYPFVNRLFQFFQHESTPLQGDCASAVQWGVLWGDGSSDFDVA